MLITMSGTRAVSFKAKHNPKKRPCSAKDPIALGGMVKEWLPKAICCFANLGKGKEHQS